tara:strand:- start:5328 stop:5789 length:462 start_codon:yes stop_codon:yes gene_type:complete
VTDGLIVLRPDDAGRTAMLHLKCFPDPWSAASLRGLLKDPSILTLGIERDGQLAGFIMGQTIVGETDILTVCTNPDLRRQGIAHHLLEAMITRCGERGVSRMTLDVAEDNIAARALYAAHGFTEDGRRPRYYSAKRDIPVDGILMSKSLELGV